MSMILQTVLTLVILAAFGVILYGINSLSNPQNMKSKQLDSLKPIPLTERIKRHD